MKTTFDLFSDWMPIRFYWREDHPFVEWCYIGKTRFTDSFFDQTIERRLREPFSLLFRHRTPIEFLEELSHYSPRVSPTGFVFHLSRCGSTLVSQMLAALEQNIVISEPPPVDSILRAGFNNPAVSDEQRVAWLRWLIAAFGQKRSETERHLFIKLDSWNTLDLDLINRAFPNVPWIFLYRNPVEVIVSHMRQRGAQMIPGIIGHILPDMDLAEVLQIPAEDYCARVLARICQSALDFLPHRNALLLNYRQLPDAATTDVLKHFKIEFAPEAVEKMRDAGRFNAKTPQLNFTADSEAKKKEASRAANEAAARWVNPLYEKLEELRLTAKTSSSGA